LRSVLGIGAVLRTNKIALRHWDEGDLAVPPSFAGRPPARFISGCTGPPPVARRPVSPIYGRPARTSSGSLHGPAMGALSASSREAES